MDTFIRSNEQTSLQNYVPDLYGSPKNCCSQQPTVLDAEIAVPAPLSPMKQLFSLEENLPELFAGYAKDLEGKNPMINESMMFRDFDRSHQNGIYICRGHAILLLCLLLLTDLKGRWKLTR